MDVKGCKTLSLDVILSLKNNSLITHAARNKLER
jgi:hypothetical protein